MIQAFDYHIWTEQSPITIEDILIANGKAHGTTPSKKSIETFTKKVIDAFYGPAILAYATPQDNPNIVCGAVAYGIYEFNIKNKKVKGGIAYTSFVVPEFQGKGIFKKLILFAQQKCKESGYAIIISFPNSNSLPGYKSAGWTFSEGLLKYMIRPATFKSIFRWLHYFKDLRKSFKGEPCDTHFEEKCPELINKVFCEEKNTSFSNNLVFPIRSQGFYLWKLCELRQSSFGIEEIDGNFIIYRRGYRGRLKEIQILDFGFKQTNTIVIRKLLKQIQVNEFADIFSLKISISHPHYYLFKKHAFFNIRNNKNLNFTYLILDESIDRESFRWVIVGLDFHMT